MTNKCPECGSEDVRTDEDRSPEHEVTRYYHCNGCGEEWPPDSAA